MLVCNIASSLAMLHTWQENGTELLLISVCYNWEELPVQKHLLMSVKKIDKIV